MGGSKRVPPWKGRNFALKAMALKDALFLIKYHKIGLAIWEARLVGHPVNPQASPTRCPVTFPGAWWQWPTMALTGATSPMQASHFNSYSIYNHYTVSPRLIVMITLHSGQIGSTNGCVRGPGDTIRASDYFVCPFHFYVGNFLKHGHSRRLKS